jgi:hypothetical protein
VTSKCLSVLFLLCGSRDLLCTKPKKPIIPLVMILLKSHNIPQNPPIFSGPDPRFRGSTDLRIQLLVRKVRKFPSNPVDHTGVNICNILHCDIWPAKTRNRKVVARLRNRS